MTPTRDPDPLEDRLRAALAQRAAGTTVGAPRHAPLADAPGSESDGPDAPASSDVEVVPLSAPDGPHRQTRRWARPAAAAAVVVLVAGGLFVAGELTHDRSDRTVTGTQPGPPPPDVAEPCGTELPFEFPVPDGFEGPVPGPVTPEMEQNTLWNGIWLRWQGENGTIDVRWPAYPPGDPTTPYAPEELDMSESAPGPEQGPDALGGYVPEDTPDDWFAQQIGLASAALGDGARCARLDVIVTGPTAETTGSVVDHIGLGLVGPRGVAPGRATLITSTTSIEAPPEIEPCNPEDVAEHPESYGGPVENQGTYATPDEALAVFHATNLNLPDGGYQQATLPDGSYAFLWHPDPERAPDFVSVAVYVDPVDGGWTVTSWESTGC